jgi:hypothetical protein
MSIGSYFKSIFAEQEQLDAGGVGVSKAQPFMRPASAPYWPPRLATVRSAPSREEFAAWRDHPVTQFVFAAMRAVAEEQEQSWHDQSWNGGNCDPVELNGLRARADTYTSMEEGGYESFCEWAGVEPEPLVVEQGEWGRL